MTVTTNADLLSQPGSMLIGERWSDAGTGGHYTHVNAATGQPQAELTLAGGEDVDAAVEAARGASEEWRNWKADRRRDVLLTLAELIRQNAAEFAEMLILEVGATARTAHGPSTAMLAEFTTYYAGWTEKLEGAVIPVYPQDALDYSVPEPFGVVAALIPWNGPLTPLGMKVIPAVAAGNTVVVKPPELAPFTTLRFGQLCLEAGIPPGVVNVVPGGIATGEALVGHPGVDKITFTGGSTTAPRVLASAAANITPVVLELGGKSANLVFDDSDLAQAVPFAATVAMLRSGQVCLAPSRLLVQRAVYQQVVDGVVATMGALKVGDPRDQSTFIGPVVSAGHCARIEGIIEQAKQAGSGRLVYGGHRMGDDLADGFYLSPTVFADVDNASALAQEEIFGPVLTIIPFDDETEAVRMANDTRYGLSAYLWTEDLKRAHRVARRLVAGSVCVNGFGLPPNAPFGGVKHSGYGREGGRAGIDEFLRSKNVLIQL